VSGLGLRGRIGKPWAVVHDNTRIPALRRLYMTATPRLWQLDDDAEPGAPGELVASMEDDPDGPFGSRCYTLTLSEAINWGICAPYQVVCVDITDTQLKATQLLGVEGRSDEVRGARLAALQTALVKASAEEDFRRTLVFHHLVKEAEAFAAGLPDVAAQLHADDPELYPSAVWADWLCGDHPPAHRRRVLDKFAGGTDTARCFLGSAKVLGEGVDIQNCDSVYFADVRGSMPDLVQAVGRALRIQPGEGKVASLVVPILLGPGENADNMLTSKAYDGLAKLLEALRAHDTRIVEALAVPQAPSRSKGVQSRTGGQDERSAEGEDGVPVSVPARALLKLTCTDRSGSASRWEWHIRRAGSPGDRPHPTRSGTGCRVGQGACCLAWRSGKRSPAVRPMPRQRRDGPADQGVAAELTGRGWLWGSGTLVSWALCARWEFFRGRGGGRQARGVDRCGSSPSSPSGRDQNGHPATPNLSPCGRARELHPGRGRAELRAVLGDRADPES
jgi:hypothetical protein